ncbi:HAMP domain-containing histidine kinase [bacterium SCSIO 12696]|nr:HAMP domain-containing histidine kinase [bacterium SCSIO 12696]
MPKTRKNLHSKMTKVFLLQVGLISLVAAAGVFAAREMIESVLMRKALEGEAEYFWQHREQNPDLAMPNTLNLRGFLAHNGDASTVPLPLRELRPGLQRVHFDGSKPIIYVEDKATASGADRLYLIFDEESVSLLTLVFGILPLTAVLVILYIFAWLAYRQSHRAISPIVKLAKVVEEAEPKEGQWLALNLDELRHARDLEVSTLVRALDHFTERLGEFIERERNFTRDASHELRTPIAVLRSSLELLERKQKDFGDATVTRMYRTLFDMEALIETLLLLAREESNQLPSDKVVINDLVKDELGALGTVFHDKAIEISVVDKELLNVDAPTPVAKILINNLLRNAYNYTPEGKIEVVLEAHCLLVKDSGPGMDAATLERLGTPFHRGGTEGELGGHGLGMAIVKRLCNRYGWTLKLDSELGKGTEVRVCFSTGDGGLV